MRWLKLGKLFDPREHDLQNECVEFAQSPQALVFKRFVRIYFSTRARDPLNNKYLSHVSFVDMSKDLKEVIALSGSTVIQLGDLGCFDEHGIFPMNVVRHGSQIYGYTCGWSRRLSVSVETSIGLALSQDEGITFQKVGTGPILTSSLDEPFLVGDPFVKIFDGIFHMWYIFGVNWKRFSKRGAPDRVYKIGHSTSADGIEWSKREAKQIVSDRLGSDESQALPTVVRWNDLYHLFFCYRQSDDFRLNSNRSYRIGYAFSDDLSTWIRDDSAVGIDVSDTGWDSFMMCYPHLFECGGRLYLLYNGNEFGRHGFGGAVLG